MYTGILIKNIICLFNIPDYETPLLYCRKDISLAKSSSGFRSFFVICHLITGILGTMLLRSKLVFTLSPENDLDIEFTNIQMDNEKYSPDGKTSVHYWQDAGTFYTDYIPIHNAIISYLDSLRSDSTSLKKCMDHFLGKFQYNYVVLKTLTEVGRSRFIQQYYIDRNYQWSLPLVDFKYNKNAKYKKKYVALFRYNIKDDNEFDKLFSNTIYLNVYTDNDSLANYTKQQLVNYKGILVNADETFASENFNFDFCTLDKK